MRFECTGVNGLNQKVTFGGNLAIRNIDPNSADISGEVHVGGKIFPVKGLIVKDRGEARIASIDRNRSLMAVIRQDNVNTLIIKGQNAYRLTCQ